MSRNTKGVVLVTGASSGIGAIHDDRLAKRGHDPAPGFVECDGKIINIASIVALAPEILDGIYNGLEEKEAEVPPASADEAAVGAHFRNHKLDKKERG